MNVIIVKGKDNLYVRTKTCRNCASILEYTTSDVIILWQGLDMSGSPDGAKGFKCPCCGENVITERW